MASSERKMDSVEGTESFYQLEASCLPVSNMTTTLLDFSQLTPSQLGISTQSFTPSSNIKEKSRLVQLKLKRRSSVGVRGSPETNSLICYIARQRMKTPPTTARLTPASPVSTKVPSTLKQKMAIFQNIMDVEENENETIQQSSPTGGCIKTRDVLSGDGWSCDGDSAGKENKTPLSQPLTPPPSKRQCTTGPLGVCVEEIREANPPILKRTATSQKTHNKELGIGQNNQHQPALTVPPGAAPQNERCGVVEHTPHTDAVSRITQGEPQPSTPLKQEWTPTEEEQDQGCSFELHSPSQTLDVCSGPDRTTLPLLFSMPSHLEIKPTDEADSSGGIVNSIVKKKQVRFGILLPPELFDKDLPPSTPLRKGGTPARVPTSAGGSQLRSLLKTPQRTPLVQPDFSSPSLTGASPTFTVKPCCRDPETASTWGKINFPSLEDEVDNSFVDCGVLQAQPLDLTSAFQEEHSVCAALPSADLVLDSVPALGPEPEPAITVPACSSSRKRKLPQEREPVKKRSMRTAAKSACGRMKVSLGSAHHFSYGDLERSDCRELCLRENSGKRSFGKKAVDRSLYGKRDYASKNPTLSPITETLSSPSRSLTSRHTPKQQSSPLEDVINTGPIAGEVMAVALWQSNFCPPASGDNPAAEPSDGPPVDSCVPTGSSADSGPGRAMRAGGRRRSGPTKPSRTKEQLKQRAVRGGRGDGRKVSVPGDDWLNEEPEQESAGSTQPEVSVSVSTKHTVPFEGQDESDVQCNLPSVGSDPDQCCGVPPDLCGREESPVRADTEPPSGQVSTAVAPSGQVSTAVAPSGQVSTAVAPSGQVSTAVAPSGQEAASHVELRPNRGTQRGSTQCLGRSRGRRKSLYASSVKEECGEEQTSQSDGPKALEEADQGGVTEQASFQHSLVPPWAQDDFSIDDVLQPLPSRGYRSVRRSLRNQSQNVSLDSSVSGLAWLPHTSPDSLKTERRKTRGRRSSIQAVLPLEDGGPMEL